MLTLTLISLLVNLERPASIQTRLRRCFDAICQVESSGDPQAIGDGGKAVGIAQIHPIYVADVNRILGRQKYTLRDRYNPVKSFEMFCIASRYYFPHGTMEQWARAFNGGGRKGAAKQATVQYWAKVRQVLR